MNIKIDRNIPVPANLKGRKAIYTPVFAQMKPGDSFAVDADKRGAVYSSFRQWRNKDAARKKLRMATMIEGKTARCWLLNGKAA